MSFIGRLIDKDKVKELTDKYKLIRPGFDDSHSLDSHMMQWHTAKKTTQYAFQCSLSKGYLLTVSYSQEEFLE